MAKVEAVLFVADSALSTRKIAQLATLANASEARELIDQLNAALEATHSSPAMETLAIVVYRQPITRADIESIRGVQSAEMLKQLMDRGLVRIGGKDDSLGRPFLYESTRKFLEIFGLKNLDDLPMGETLRIRPEKPGQPVAETEEETDLETVAEEVIEEHETAEIAEDADDDLSAA